MKKLIEYQRKIEFPVYHYRINIVITDNIMASRGKRSNVLGSPDSWRPGDEFVDGMHSYKESSFESYVFLQPNTCQGTLVHEAYHAVSRMFRLIGEDKAGEEIFAYTLGHLVEEIHRFYKDKKRK